MKGVCMQKKTTCKPLEELTLMDRFLFAETMENPENMKLMLDIILDDDITLKGIPQAEKELRKSSIKRLARLDIWTKDIHNTIYDTEIQNRNTNNLIKRTRYYQAMIDCKLLEPGERDFNQMSNVYIILITPFDLFGYGLYRYTFVGHCLEIPELKMNDGVTRIFLNTRGTNSEGVSLALVELLKYMERTNDTSLILSNNKTQKLRENINMLKKNEQYSIRYLRFREAFYDEYEEEIEADKATARSEGRKEGREEGREEGRGDEIRHNILLFLQFHGKIPTALQEKITAQKEINTLRNWLIIAARTDSIEEFEKQIV